MLIMSTLIEIGMREHNGMIMVHNVLNSFWFVPYRWFHKKLKKLVVHRQQAIVDFKIKSVLKADSSFAL